MDCAVTVLRRNGQRLPRKDWPEPIAGRLEMVEHSAEHSSFKRTTRVLQIMEKVGLVERPALLLFEPQLLDVTPDAFVFRGIELERRNDNLSEHVQIWLVKPEHEHALNSLHPTNGASTK